MRCWGLLEVTTSGHSSTRKQRFRKDFSNMFQTCSTGSSRSDDVVSNFCAFPIVALCNEHAPEATTREEICRFLLVKTSNYKFMTSLAALNRQTVVLVPKCSLPTSYSAFCLFPCLEVELLLCMFRLFLFCGVWPVWLYLHLLMLHVTLFLFS